MPPTKVRHVWRAYPHAPGIYGCSHCKARTADRVRYRTEVCPVRDRRKGPAERRLIPCRQTTSR